MSLLFMFFCEVQNDHSITFDDSATGSSVYPFHACPSNALHFAVFVDSLDYLFHNLPGCA